jgi:hypothetical protein
MEVLVSGPDMKGGDKTILPFFGLLGQGPNGSTGPEDMQPLIWQPQEQLLIP